MTTFEEIMKSLFYNQTAWYVDMFGKIKSNRTTLYADRNNCTSQAHIDKWLCVNDMINVSRFYNQDWTPDWSNREERKFTVAVTNIAGQQFGVIEVTDNISGFVVFRSYEDAQKAMTTLGKEKLTLIFLK